MAKIISFEYNGKEYTIEFTRRSVEIMEKKGFNISEIDAKPMTVIPALFEGAFIAHHKYIKKETVDEIYSKLKCKDTLFEKLADMYNDTILSLLDEPEESEGNVEWKASW